MKRAIEIFNMKIKGFQNLKFSKKYYIIYNVR